MKIRAILVLACLLSFASHAGEVLLNGEDGFVLSSEYFAPAKPQPRGVLMLHQCNYNRTMYDVIGKALAEKGVHALSLDFRGFGKSTTTEVNVDLLDGLPEQQQRDTWRSWSANWVSDTQIVLDYLRDKVGENGVVGVIGASCGGGMAIRLSEQNTFAALALFSSAQNEQNIERYQSNLSAVPTMVIAAEEDGRTYTTAQQVYAHATNPSSKFVVYKGDAHGYPLYEQDLTLADNIVDWFDRHMK